MRISFLALVTLLVTAACGGGEVTGDTTAWPRPDGDWQLATGVDVPADYPITMSIRGTEISGRAACNSYGGAVEVNGSSVTVGDEIARTAMGCEPPVMAAEEAFLAALTAVDSFEYRGERLVFKGPTDDLLFDPVLPAPTADLVGTTWVLETLVEGETASSVGGDPATLTLSTDGSLTASTGCRDLTGRWLESGGVIIVPELSADGECPDELWKQDSLVVTVIGDEFRAEVDGEMLTLSSMGGDGLVFRAEG
ncbi:MAG: META domain-containing protein [Acidimicrobiia bacterium]|nr:META domain-containing protein [Acidimicrobiia bacterium]